MCHMAPCIVLVCIVLLQYPVTSHQMKMNELGLGSLSVRHCMHDQSGTDKLAKMHHIFSCDASSDHNPTTTILYSYLNRHLLKLFSQHCSYSLSITSLEKKPKLVTSHAASHQSLCSLAKCCWAHLCAAINFGFIYDQTSQPQNLSLLWLEDVEFCTLYSSLISSLKIRLAFSDQNIVFQWSFFLSQESFGSSLATSNCS